MPYRSIAIDGPSGAGKSTLAKLLAECLHYRYVDTGAIYRTVGLAAFRAGVDPSDEGQVAQLLSTLDMGLSYGEDGLQRMYLDGEDVTDQIRLHEMSRYASQVSALPSVRAFLLETQRRIAQEENVVMDGRDIGTVVLPQADLKIFLTASPGDRAKRRHQELQERGDAPSMETVLADLIRRDEADSHRAVAPLRQAEDAVLLDTTGNSLSQSFEQLKKIVEERLPL